MILGRKLRELCLLILIGGLAWSFDRVTLAGEPLVRPVVTAKWQTVRLGHPRRWHTATALTDGRVLIAGGDEEESIATTEVYEPTGKIFASGPRLPGRQIWRAAASIAEGVLIAGGLDLGDASRADVSRGKVRPVGTTTAASVVDVPRGTARAVGSMIVARQQFMMTPLLDSTVFVFGGTGRGSYTTTETYDPRTQRFTRTGDMLVKRFSCAATLLTDGRVLLTGGTSSDEATYNKRIADAEIYDPVTRLFTKTGSMKRSRSGHTSTLLPDGRILITGGINEKEGITASAELYDPKVGTFREVAPMRLPRSGHATTPLSDGRILITGGGSYVGKKDVILRSVELFDPVLEKFMETEPMGTPRMEHSATLLPTGEVLIVGGFGIDSATTAELFRLGM